MWKICKNNWKKNPSFFSNWEELHLSNEQKTVCFGAFFASVNIQFGAFLILLQTKNDLFTLPKDAHICQYHFILCLYGLEFWEVFQNMLSLITHMCDRFRTFIICIKYCFVAQHKCVHAIVSRLWVQILRIPQPSVSGSKIAHSVWVGRMALSLAPMTHSNTGQF